MWKRALVATGLVIAACACPSAQAPGPVTVGSGSGTAAGSASGPPASGVSCDAVRPRIEALYRAEATAREPKRVDEAVADNLRMVATDCARAPATVAPCLATAATIADVERKCLVPLDPEGTEGDAIGRAR